VARVKICDRSSWVELTSVTVALKVEPELEDSIGEYAFESAFVGVFPLAIDDFEGNVLIRGSRTEPKDYIVRTLRSLQEIPRRLLLVQQIRIEDLKQNTNFSIQLIAH